MHFQSAREQKMTIQCEGEDEEEALKAMLDCIHKLKEIQPETKG